MCPASHKCAASRNKAPDRCPAADIKLLTTSFIFQGLQVSHHWKGRMQTSWRKLLDIFEDNIVIHLELSTV